MMSDQEILEKYKLSIEQDIKELLQEKNISDIFEIEAFTKKYKENFVVGFRKGQAEEKIRVKIEIARRMLLKGKNIEEIMDITDLSVEEIKDIEAKIKS
jgi:predicted transposase/invertase (TIGR01784 family)